jgi:uroporphyrinogen decarboxylase
MTNRENILRALRRDKPERVPFEFVLCPSKIEEFKERTGKSDYLDYYQFPIRYVELNPTVKKTDFRIYYKNLPSNAKPLSWNPDWGVMGIPGSVAHFEEMAHPMEDFESVEQIRDYPFPDLCEDYRWDGFEGKVSKLKDEDLIAVGFMQMTIFEVAWYLRGMDNFMVDMAINPELAEALLDEITKIRIDMAERYAKCGIDILMLGDDVSTQHDMMMNPDLWRKMLKPRLAEVIKAAKSNKPDILIFYHGDGNLQKIIPDLIEIGVDILNPVQPECMDPIEIKKLYGDRLSLWGTLGTQTTMPFGTPEDVKSTCKRLMETTGAGGGLFLAPTHMIEPEVPWENIQAFIDTVKEYGKY